MRYIQNSTVRVIFGLWLAILVGLSYGGVGSGGTGRSSFGSITAFGSIFVNGIEYSTSTANIIINGVSNQPESALKLGMAVRVEGSINPDGLTGTATIVEYVGDIEGVIDAAPVITGTRGTFRIYGLVVNTDSKTIYDNIASLAALAGGDVVEVSGFFNANDSSFTATRIEKKPAFRKVELRGYVSNVTATTFVLGPSLVVNYSAAELKDIPLGGLVNGLYVEVKATTQPTNNVLPATRVSVEGSILASTNIAYGLLQGVAAKVTSNSFEIGNQLIVTNAETVFKAGTASAPNGPAKALPIGLVSGVKAFASGPVVNGVMTAEVVTVIPVIAAAYDLSGDGNSDLIFRNTATGEISAWIMNGTAVTQRTNLLGPEPSWTIAHIADFNGDGKADILWRSTSGSVGLWLMDGITVLSTVSLLGPEPNWLVSHVGDFNGDGKADILWRNNANGAVNMWLMNGGTILSTASLLAANAEWSVSHIGDFNGDGKADLLWRNSSNGAVNMWLMNGGTVSSGGSLLGANAEWRVSHTGDFNGDGKTDLVWRNTNGAVNMWLMNGATVATASMLLGSTPDWSVSHIGDFNGDGKADMLWRNNSNGAVNVWLMNGGSVSSGVSLLSANAEWRVSHTGDFNGDGKADLVWRNTNNGAVNMWLMNGAALLSATGILGATTWGVTP